MGMERIGLKKDRNARVKDVMVYVRSLYNPLDDLKEIDRFEHKNYSNIYGTKPTIYKRFCGWYK